MQLAVEIVIVVSTVILFLLFFLTLLNNPEAFFRLAARVFFIPFSQSGRKALGETFPSIGYSYFGTTGDAARDTSIRRRIRLASRGFVLVSLGGVVFMFLFTIVMSLFS